MGKFLKANKKKIIFAILAIVVIVVILFAMLNKKAAALPVVETTVLEKTDLINSVNTTGYVESKETKYVFTSLALPVETNLVEVGDHVNEGDVLCELDASSVEKNIAQQSASAGAQAAINNNAIAMSEKQLEEAKEDLRNELNGTVFQAEQALETAKQNLERSEIALDGAVDAVQNARREADLTGLDDTRSMTDPAANQRDLAYANYENAKQAVVDAENALEIARNGVERQVSALEDNLKSTQVASGSLSGQWVAINNLRDDLKDATVTSPISGVVTGVFVKEGGTATGLMYVVEDVDHLQINAALKEYDLSLVKQGDEVSIKSDATGDEEFEGRLSKIAPTTKKNPQTGETIEKNPEFDSEINVMSPRTGLRIGTKARMDIIYEKKPNVISVPFESIGTDAQGNSAVFVLEEEVAGVYVLKAIPVETGMETDFRVELISSDLKEGDIIVARAIGMTDGMRVQLNPDATLASADTGTTTVEMAG